MVITVIILTTRTAYTVLRLTILDVPWHLRVGTQGGDCVSCKIADSRWTPL